ncbi:MAG: TetR/AcrR family transcriptional regulator [Pseudomonadota bacterium]
MKRGQSRADFKEKSKQLWKTEIIKVATAAFKQKGYHGTTMEDIAQKLKITKGSLYYYFKNKEAILFNCHMASLDIIDKVLQDVEGSNLSPSEKIHAVIYRYLDKMLDELLASVLLLEEESLSPKLLTQVIKRRDRAECTIREIVAEGIRRGEFRDEDPKLLTFAILGAMNWTPKWYNSAGEKNAPDVARVFAGYLVSGLRK